MVNMYIKRDWRNVRSGVTSYLIAKAIGKQKEGEVYVDNSTNHRAESNVKSGT